MQNRAYRPAYQGHARFCRWWVNNRTCGADVSRNARICGSAQGLDGPQRAAIRHP